MAKPRTENRMHVHGTMSGSIGGIDFSAPIMQGASHQDVLGAVEHLRRLGYRDAEHVRAELIDGLLWYTMPGKGPHNDARNMIFRRLSNAFDIAQVRPGSWYFTLEHTWNDGRSERICPEDRSTTVVPDVMGYYRPDWPSEAETKERAAPHMASTPHWVCEVLSPSTMLKDRGCKFRYYERMGVRHYWIVDPDERTLEVFELDQESRRYGEAIAVIEENDPVLAAPFKPIELLPRLGELWTVPSR